MNIDLIYTNIIDRNSFRLSSRDLVRKNEEAIRKEFSVGSLHFNRRLQVTHNAAISSCPPAARAAAWALSSGTPAAPSEQEQGCLAARRLARL